MRQGRKSAAGYLVASQVVWHVKPNKLISSYLITHAWQCYQAPTDWSLRMNSGGYVQVISSPLSIRRLASSTGTGGNACWGPPEKWRRSDCSSGFRSSRALGVVEWFAAAARPHDCKCSCPTCEDR